MPQAAFGAASGVARVRGAMPNGTPSSGSETHYHSGDNGGPARSPNAQGPTNTTTPTSYYNLNPTAATSSAAAIIASRAARQTGLLTGGGGINANQVMRPIANSARGGSNSQRYPYTVSRHLNRNPHSSSHTSATTPNTLPV